MEEKNDSAEQIGTPQTPLKQKSSVKGNQAVRAAFWYLVCNFLLKGISFVTTPIFTRLMSTSDYGIFSTYNSYVSILTVVTTLDLYACVQISKHDFKGENNSFISSVLFLSSISVLAFYGLLKVVMLFTGNLFELPEHMIDIMFLYIFFENAFTIMQTQHRAYLRYRMMVCFTVISTILSVVFGVWFVKIMQQDKYWGRIIAGVIPAVIIGIYAMVSIYVKGHCLIRKQFWRYAVTVCIPLIPHHLSGRILASFDRIMINSICGSVDAAIYSLAYNVAAIIEVVWFSFNSAWTPWFYDKMADGKTEDIKKAVKPYIIVFSFFIVGAIAAGPEVVKVLGTRAYWEGKWIIPPVVLGLFFQFMYSLYINIEMYNKKTKTIAVGTTTAAMLNVALNYIFIPILGYIAAAYTTLVGYILMFLFHYLQSGKLEKRDLYGKKFLFFVVMGMCLFTVVMSALYQTIIIRYALLGIIAIAVFWKYKKEILNTIMSYMGKKN